MVFFIDLKAFNSKLIGNDQKTQYIMQCNEKLQISTGILTLIVSNTILCKQPDCSKYVNQLNSRAHVIKLNQRMNEVHALISRYSLSMRSSGGPKYNINILLSKASNFRRGILFSFLTTICSRADHSESQLANWLLILLAES